MLIRASEVSRADLGLYAKDLAQSLLGQTRFEVFCYSQDINLTRSFLAFIQGRCVGVALLAQRGQRVHLSVLAVHPDYRSQGLGKELLDAVQDEAGSTELTLDVLERNAPALRFFSSRGFKVKYSHGFWYRTLPLQWSKDGPQPREVSVDIALELTNPSYAWAAESRALSKKAASLNGVVCVSGDKVAGSAVYSGGLNNIVIHRLSVELPNVAHSIIRHMHLHSPAASTVFLRWMKEDYLSEHLLSMGLRRYSRYHTLSMRKAGVSQV